MSGANTGAMFGGRILTLPRIALALAVLTTLLLFRDRVFPSTITHTSFNPKSPVPNAAANSPPAILYDSSPPPPLHHQAVPPPKSLPSPSPMPNANHTCMSLPGADKIMVLLKTGATELYAKLPTHFMTTFRCTPHYLLYSDLSQTFADVSLHDAIDPISNATRTHHPDFELYRSLQQRQNSGLDLSNLAGDSGWNLDKWKFLPMFHHAFANSPESIDWFIMIEADTSLSWLNLLQWLPRLDASQPLYIGSQNMIGSSFFAHGGSGVLISRPAVAAMETLRQKEGPETYDARWELNTAKSCCGDDVLARALLEAGTPLTGAWPIIQGETVSTVDFTNNHWCAPPVTWHHVSPSEVDAQWQFQFRWADKYGWSSRPYLYADIFRHFVAPHIKSNRTNWNNLSEDDRFVAPHLSTKDDRPFGELEAYEREAVESVEKCAAACERKGEERCVQWKFMPGRCHLGKAVRLGKSDEANEGEQGWTSGWVDREVVKECQDIRWDVLAKQG